MKLPLLSTMSILLCAFLCLGFSQAGELEEAIKTAQEGKTPEERLAGIEILAKYDDQQTTTVLIGRLWDQDEAVRLAAVKALEKRGWKPPSEPIEAQYLVAKKDWVKIPELGEDALRSLVMALKLPQSEVREKACWALGEIGDPSALEHLRNIYRHDKSPQVRMAAKSAMDKIQAQVLAEQKKREERPFILYLIIGALAVILLIMFVSLIRSRKR